MKNLRLYIFLVFLVLNLYSCDNFNLIMNVDCTQCVRVEPDDVDATILLSYENDGIPLTIYEGKYEIGTIIFQDTIFEEEFIYNLNVDAEYTIAAEYNLIERTIIVIDSEYIEKRLASSECQLDCWVVLGGDFDLRLKY